MHDSQGRWLPDLSPRGLELFNARDRYLLAWGPRKTGKTIAVLNRLVRHAFESPSTTIAIVAKTLKVGRIGPWSDLLRYILPKWIAAKIGFEITREESFMADTKMCYIRVRSPYSLETQIELHSCEHPDEAESRFKSGRWSLVYISEADTFPDPKPFRVLSDQLRNPLMPFAAHQFLMDANPAVEGEDHWLHKTFFGPQGTLHPSPAYSRLFREMRFDFSDNPWLAPEEKAELQAKYESDPVDRARFLDGVWLADRSRYLFGEVFRPATHVIGGSVGGGESEYLAPSQSCIEMYTGWDLGDRNHACVIFASRETDAGLPAFDVFDEIVALNRDTALSDFVEAVMDRMDFWEAAMGGRTLQWRHWSDSSSFRYRSAIDSNEELEVRRISGGRILLHAAQKAPHSVRMRVKLVRKLLFENRLFFSAFCPKLIDSIAMLREGPSKAEYIRTDDPRKHAFDALTYGLSHANPIDVTDGPTIRRRRLLPVFSGR